MNQSNTSKSADVTTLSLAQIASWQNTTKATSEIIAKVPSLQRGAVWKPGQVELLWDSILRGFPIGAFVVCNTLQNQSSRKGQNDRSKNNTEPTHHLLDGQQRANAIALGFDNPFINNEILPRAVLWLDLAPKFAANSTRSFLFRVTTEAHPWGYSTSDEATSISHKKMRDAIGLYGKERQKLKLTDTWPMDAICPIPFSWLMQNISVAPNSEACFWEAIINLCAEKNKPWSDQVWVKNFQAKKAEIQQAQIFNGLNYANNLRVVALEVPDDVLKHDLHRVEENMTHNENIANVEHLFQRLNAGGTVLDGEELAYSMIKAYWPEIEQPIEELVVKRMPASRLAMLGTRAALSKNNPKLPGLLNVSAMRNLAQKKEETIRNFFLPPSNQITSIGPVLGQVDMWLGENFIDDIGLPPVLLSAIARGAPDVYLLLMWLADQFLSNAVNKSNQFKHLRKRLIGLATALHWFGVDRRLAAATLYEILNNKENLFCDDSFKGILQGIYTLDGGKIGLYQIPSPDELDALIILPIDEATLKEWHWWKLAKDTQNQELPHYQIVQRIKQEKVLLLYAQREHLRIAYPNYDPARQDLWEQHNRPWDYDHILPSKIIYYQQNISNGVKEWANSIANLRAWPMEENRSDQDESPVSKLDEASKLTGSFINQNELDGFEIGYKDITNSADALAFVESAKKRLLRIYKEWYDTLDIGFLTK